MNSVDEFNGFGKLTKEELLSLDLLTELFSTDDDVLLSTYINSLEDRARELKCVSQLKRTLKAFEKERKKAQKENLAKTNSLPATPEIANITNFPEGCAASFDSLNCGDWIANTSGVKKVYPNGEYIASYFPIWPICYYRNVENHLEKVAVAYYKNNQWNYRTVFRSEISSTQEMLRKTNFGLPATSKTASALVDYLQEVEALNENTIPVKRSTTKMGWHSTENELVFMPYTDKLDFDGDNSYNDLYASIHEEGSYELWLDAVKKIRATKRFEPLFFLAASFASPLLELLGVQSFAISLWGNTEGGKTVSTRLATSVWADSRKGAYWGSFQSTETAFEIKQGFLNNLPMFIDDSANIKDKERFSYSTFAYNRCNEKGKSRSNIARGIEVEYTWRQIILMTGEHPFITEKTQGGAINRTLEITCGAEKMFDDPKGLCDILEYNYGFAGKDFIEAVKAMTPEKVKEIYKTQLERVNKLDKMGKQSDALAAVLTGDIIAERVIFKDGILIDLETAASSMADKSAVSEDERCYEYLIEQIAVYSDRFVPLSFDEETKKALFKGEQWGQQFKNDPDVYIIKSQFDKLCIQGGFSPKRFLDWAAKNGKIEVAKTGEYTKPKRLSTMNGTVRCVHLLLRDDEEENNEISEALEGGVPF